MNSKSSLSLNALLNLTRSILSVIFPVITYPYAAKTLGAENIGKISYVSSIVSYFSLFASLGVSSYGVRDGSKYRDNKKCLNRFVNEVFSINIITTVLSLILMFFAVTCINELKEYKFLLLILSASVVFSALSIDWINVIYEDYLIITIRNIFSYVICFFLLILSVNDSDDYYKYAFLQVLPGCIVCITNLVYCRKYIKLRFTRKINANQHIKKMAVFFANSLAISLYVNSDITMLGILSTDLYVGLYSGAAKVYNIIKNGIAAIYAVSVPRLAYYYAENKLDKYKAVYSRMFGLIILVLLPAMFGLIGVSKEIMYILGGFEYIAAAPCLSLLGIALIFAICGGLVTACLNVTIGREKDNLIATIIGALINIILNIFFIPKYGMYGAAITTVLAEAFVFLFCFIRIKHKNMYIDFRFIKIETIHALLGCCAVIGWLYIVRLFIKVELLLLALSVIGSVILYSIILFIVKDEVVMDFKDRLYTKFGVLN